MALGHEHKKLQILCSCPERISIILWWLVSVIEDLSTCAITGLCKSCLMRHSFTLSLCINHSEALLFWDSQQIAKFKETEEKVFALAGLLGMEFWWGGKSEYHIFALLPLLSPCPRADLKMKLSVQQYNKFLVMGFKAASVFPELHFHISVKIQMK